MTTMITPGSARLYALLGTQARAALWEAAGLMEASPDAALAAVELAEGLILARKGARRLHPDLPFESVDRGSEPPSGQARASAVVPWPAQYVSTLPESPG